MISDKFSEKSLRTRYIRALERFASAGISMLKKENFDEIKFQNAISKNLKILSRVTPVYLDSTYLKELENFITLLCNEKDKEILLKSANLLSKLKNSKNYKKTKHKKDIYENHNF